MVVFLDDGLLLVLLCDLGSDVSHRTRTGVRLSADFCARISKIILFFVLMLASYEKRACQFSECRCGVFVSHNFCQFSQYKFFSIESWLGLVYDKSNSLISFTLLHFSVAA